MCVFIVCVCVCVWCTMCPVCLCMPETVEVGSGVSEASGDTDRAFVFVWISVRGLLCVRVDRRDRSKVREKENSFH